MNSSRFRYLLFSVATTETATTVASLEGSELGPEFQKAVWPILEHYLASITSSYLWYRSQGRRLTQRIVQRLPIECGPFSELVPLSEMTSDQLDIVYTLAGFPLTVFFETRDYWFLQALCRQWPVGSLIQSEDGNVAGLPSGEVSVLADALSRIQPGYVWLSFADEGESLYLFGDDNLLVSASQVGGMTAPDRMRRRLPIMRPKPSRA